MHLLVFFCPLVGSFIIFFRQLICRVVTIILLVSQFSDLLSRSFRSRSFLFQNFEDKPCGDNAACGAAYYTPKNFVRGHFIKFDGIRYSVPLTAFRRLLYRNFSSVSVGYFLVTPSMISLKPLVSTSSYSHLSVGKPGWFHSRDIFNGWKSKQTLKLWASDCFRRLVAQWTYTKIVFGLFLIKKYHFSR